MNLRVACVLCCAAAVLAISGCAYYPAPSNPAKLAGKHPAGQHYLPCSEQSSVPCVARMGAWK